MGYESYLMDAPLPLQNIKIDAFDYNLPRSLIAQYPSPQRGETRLMVLHRNNGTIEHQQFSDLSNYLCPGDLLVLNDTRVLPVRLVGRKESGGKCELLLLPSWNGKQGGWKVLVKGAHKMKGKTLIRFDQGFEANLEVGTEGRVEVTFSGQTEITDVLRKIGHIPLPPYIKRADEPLDRDRYQTIFAQRDGSVAAPTAGLHFTQPLLQSLTEHGVRIAMITLHIGIGTFTPVKVKYVEDHVMEAEWFEIPEDTIRAVEETKKRGHRVIAVGTTTTRALESAANGNGSLKPGKGMTSLFIYPSYRFRLIDGLVTNFHLPKSTLILLVSAFAGEDLIRKAYREAIERTYRFYSYGDAMLIL